MPFFKKKQLTKNPDTKKIKKSEKHIKKKTRIGFKLGKQEKNIPEKKVKIKTINKQKDDDLTEILETTKEDIETKGSKEETLPSKKKKTPIRKDIKGKPVFLEDTGEKLGTVFDVIYDKDNNITGVKVKDISSDTVLSFQIDQFDYTKDGLIFIPGWYTNALKIIEKLEFKDRISPELTALLSDDAVSNEELYDIFVKYDSDMVQYIDDAKSLREMLDRRLKILEKQRLSLKQNLMDLTEKRLIKDIDRRQFSEEVMEHRRKVNILDININKCKELLKRLDNTSFGVLGKKSFLFKDNNITRIDGNIDKNLLENIFERKTTDTLKNMYNIKKEDMEDYKEKYFTLKEQFERLEEDYQELKAAVDKLVTKT